MYNVQGVHQRGKPGEPGDVKQFESGPKRSGKSQGILKKAVQVRETSRNFEKQASQGKVKEF